MTLEQQGAKKVLAIIPARGGSKGIPGKNLKKIEGRSLIEHAFDCAREAKSPLTVVLSTDDAEILQHGRQMGIELVERPAELATDQAKVIDAIKHCLHQMESRKGARYEIVVLLQPTSPIRNGEDLDAVLRLFDRPEVESVISVVSANEVHPARMYEMADNKLVPLDKRYETANRQIIRPVYYRNGCFYAIRRETMLRENTLMPQNKTPYVMPASRLCNIDEPVDLIIAKALVKAWKEGKI